MTQVGMLWLVTEKNYEVGLLKGIEHFEKTFGIRPDGIELNPAHEIKEVDGIKCTPNHKVQKVNAMYVSNHGLEALQAFRKL